MQVCVRCVTAPSLTTIELPVERRTVHGAATAVLSRFVRTPEWSPAACDPHARSGARFESRAAPAAGGKPKFAVRLTALRSASGSGDPSGQTGALALKGWRRRAAQRAARKRPRTNAAKPTRLRRAEPPSRIRIKSPSAVLRPPSLQAPRRPLHPACSWLLSAFREPHWQQRRESPRRCQRTG